MPWHNLHPYAWESAAFVAVVLLPRWRRLPRGVQFHVAREARNRYLFLSETFRRLWRERQRMAA